MTGMIIFITGTLVILFFSWNSLSKPLRHGFYRFFAWEFILIQLCLNISSWFFEPFSWHQLISWIILFLSLPVLFLGVFTLVKFGRSETNFETTTRLVQTGIYRFIRHPMYASLLFLSLGLFFKSPSWLDGLLLILASFALFLTARADERECLAKFGKEYADYMQKTKRFIPFLF